MNCGMSRILLTTLNARYSHTSFGLRCLLANLGDLRASTELVEFTINDQINDVLAEIVRRQPTIVGIGVYIWNVEPVTRLLADLRRVLPDAWLVLGGPEVSYETDQQAVTALADYVITGEGDHAFRELCERLLSGVVPVERVIAGGVPDLSTVALPYHEYTAEDIANRVVYVEASRGCPFTCEFCLSALDIPVRMFPLAEFLRAMQLLLDRGVRQFKFVDRTFNLNLRLSQAILQFFLERVEPGLFLHFELIPDRLPESLRDLIVQFPAGSLQFEIGIQTFNEEVGELISRRQDNAIAAANLRWLREHTAVHLHADLIAGLPGETLQSFAAGFDRLWSLRPHEIQVGLLKRLRGTPILRHDEAHGLVWSGHSPWEILQTACMSFEELQQVRRFARFWDLYGNSGSFQESLPLLLRSGESPFAQFMGFSTWVWEREQRRHNIALIRLYELLFEYLQECGTSADEAAVVLYRDYVRGGRRDTPAFLRGRDLPSIGKLRRVAADQHVPTRQRRHLGELPTE